MPGHTTMPPLRRTVYLPRHLAAATKELVQQGKARSQNDLIVMALQNLIDQIKREAIDAEFARMSEDPEYQQEALAICREFEGSDWEALHRAEAENSHR
ncbi:MAG TPA: CopG family transcriptional regulator [Armatimonadota bacterium]|nr:CopG family transcriptional regulator [Armatimonadota bacterium]